MVHPGDEVVWFWAGAVVLLLGAGIATVSGLRRDATSARRFHVLVTLAALAMGVAYVLMALGVGGVSVGLTDTAVTVYWARYLGWVLAAPAVLASLWLLADGTSRTLSALVVLAILAIVLDAAAALVSEPVGNLTIQRTRLGVWGAGTVALLALLVVFVRVLGPQAGRQPPEVAVRFSMLRNVVVVVAVAYPVIWILSPVGLGVIDQFLASAAYLFLDIIAILGIGTLLLRDAETLVRARSG